MRVVLITIVLLLTFSIINSQIIDWTKTFGSDEIDYGVKIIESPDNGYLFLGYKYSPIMEDNSIYLLKLDEFGLKEWDKEYSPFSGIVPHDIVSTFDGGYAISCLSATLGADMYILKTDGGYVIGGSAYNKTFEDAVMYTMTLSSTTGCCISPTGDINNDGGALPDISDLLYLVDYMFQLPGTAPAPECMEETDINGDGAPTDSEPSPIPDISDLLYLVDYMFQLPGTAPEPVDCL